jgi:phospholipase/carboxylesterase
MGAAVSLVARRRDAAGEPDGALVLLHGRGADENDLYPLLDVFDAERRLAGYTPRGPLSLPPGGAHWYIVPRVGYPDHDTFHASFAQAAEWLDGLGVPPERMVLGGFSQGAVMTFALGLGRGRPRYAGLIGLSGFVPTVEGWEPDLDRDLPPVAIGHGTYDPIIDVEFSRRARDLLEAAGADVTYRESPMPHAIDPQFAAELPEWIRRALGAPAPRAR